MQQVFNQNNSRLKVGVQSSVRPHEITYTPDAFATTHKKSFLVYSRHKYLIIPTDTIGFFYIKNEYTVLVCFDGQEHFVNYSLEQIQQLISELQFFRLNRQYLVNIDAIKEVQHYFARKLLVKLAVPTKEELLVSRERSTTFLRWLENR